jgi:tetratricopeptide (TPR) repeat protein
MSRSTENSLEEASARFDSEFARGQALASDAQTDLAIQAFDACIACVEGLLQLEPGNSRFEQWMAISYASRAEVQAEAGQGPQALESYERAVSLFERIREQTGQSIGAMSDLVRAQGKVIDILIDLDDRERAHPVALELEALLESVALASEASDPQALEIWAAGHSELGRCFGAWGPKRKASWHQLRAANLLQEALSHKPGDAFLELNLAIGWLLCGQNLGPSAAMPYFEKSYELLKSLQQRLELPPQGEQALEKVRRLLGWKPLHGPGGPANRVVRLG